MTSVLLLLVLLLLLVGLVLQVLALVDAVRRPESDLAGRGGKTLWVALLAVTLVVPGGAVLALVYLAGVRPGARTA